MKLQQLNPGSCRTYLAISEKHSEAILIDPLIELVEDYLKLIDQQRLRISYIVDTHTHADHLSGSPMLADYLNVPYAMYGSAKQQCVNKKLSDGEILVLGDTKVRCLHTPGHTNDSMTLLIDENVLTGDFLFIGGAGAGRTDLPTGSSEEHFDSLQKLSNLPDGHLIYPGHDYHGNTFSTVGAERKKNPTLRFNSKREYTKWISSLTLQPAPWMLDVIKANYHCNRDSKAVFIPAEQAACEVQAISDNAPLIQTISVEEVKQRLVAKANLLILDVRDRAEYQGDFGHIEGSVLIPLSELPARIDEIKGMNKAEIVTVCNVGGRSKSAAEMLIQAGLHNVSSMVGGMKRWKELS